MKFGVNLKKLLKVLKFKHKFQSKTKATNSLNAVAHERNSKLKFRSRGSKRFASFCALILLNFGKEQI